MLRLRYSPCNRDSPCAEPATTKLTANADCNIGTLPVPTAYACAYLYCDEVRFGLILLKNSDFGQNQKIFPCTELEKNFDEGFG